MAVTTSNGDGFALYNGVKLPNIDSVWTGELKETHPYAYIDVIDLSTLGLSGIFANFNAFSKSAYQEQYTHVEGPFKRISYAFASNDEAATAIGLSAAGEWVLLGEEDVLDNTIASFGPATWTNHDILNADNSVYLAASDPIPLDGMNVIEWDGDTTGLVSSSANTHYKVSDVVLSASDLVGSVIAIGGEALVVPAEFITNGEGYASIDTYVLSCQNEGVSFDGNTLPEKGLYLINAFDVHLPFFAYTSSGGDSGDDEDDDEGDTSPKEKHYCRVDGTVYEVESGTAKMGGTFCEVNSGTVLIDGTVYDFALN